MRDPAAIGRKINDSLPLIREAFDESKVVFVEEVLSQMLQRIFNEGKAASGADIGEYKPDGYHKKIRKAGGFRVDKVDLQFTGSLFESIDIGKVGDKPVIGITDDKNVGKSVGIEARYKKVIFSPSEDEIEKGAEKAQEFLIEKLDRITDKW